MPMFDLTMAELGGTFRPDTHGCAPGIFASYAFCPEAEEEDRRVSGPRRYVSVDDIPEPEPFAGRPARIEGSLHETMKRLLAQSPRWLLEVYLRAVDDKDMAAVRVELPYVVRALLKEGVYRPNGRDKSFFNTLRARAAAGCSLAASIVATP